MKVVVMTDVHANLPALEAAFEMIEAEGYDRIYHLGDAIAIGPYPGECLESLLETARIKLIMGNHDKWFVEGLPQPQPKWMNDGEVEHQVWTHAKIDPQLKRVVGQWSFVEIETIEGVRVAFLHYGLGPSGHDFASTIKDPKPNDLDRLFGGYDVDLVMYGHTHQFVDLHGRAHYLNPGALGCHHQATARYTVIHFENGDYRLEHRAVGYDHTPLIRAYKGRQVPEREFIDKAFFGGGTGVITVNEIS